MLEDSTIQVQPALRSSNSSKTSVLSGAVREVEHLTCQATVVCHEMNQSLVAAAGQVVCSALMWLAGNELLTTWAVCCHRLTATSP
jgi:hypothetical protein